MGKLSLHIHNSIKNTMGNWKENIFSSCFNNFCLSCTACCLFPVSVYKNAEKVGEPGTPWMFAAAGCPLSGAWLRDQILKKKGIDEHVCVGRLVWCLLPCFAVAQESVELGTMDLYVPPAFQKMENRVREGKA